MTALAASINVEQKEGKKESHPVAVDIIYRGALVKHNAAGFLAPCASEAGAKFAGVATEEVDNSGGSAGDLQCKVDKEGVFLLTGSSFAQTDVGLPVYASDDQTITKTYAADLQLVGYIEEFVSATQVWVRIAVDKGVGEAAIADVTGGATVDAEARTAVNSILAALRKAEIIQG